MSRDLRLRLDELKGFVLVREQPNRQRVSEQATNNIPATTPAGPGRGWRSRGQQVSVPACPAFQKVRSVSSCSRLQPAVKALAWSWLAGRTWQIFRNTQKCSANARAAFRESEDGALRVRLVGPAKYTNLREPATCALMLVSEGLPPCHAWRADTTWQLMLAFRRSKRAASEE